MRSKSTVTGRIATVIFTFIIFFFVFHLINFVAATTISNQDKITQIYSSLELNVTESTNNIVNHVRILSSLQSRVPGYPGHQEAATYIINKFAEYGLEPGGEEGYSQYFNVSIPIDLGAQVEILPNGPVFQGYALWPNLIQTSKTPEGGLEGKLVYVGTGTLKELNGRDIEGNVALMDFNSGSNWLNLVRLGAKGVIFIEPESTTRIQAETKFLLTPLYFPRIYISKDVGNILKGFADNGTDIRITSDMIWKEVKDQNIIGVIPGTKYPNDTIIFAAHYDDWSIVPSFAPGADDATGVAALLELARLMKQNPPLRTVLFVALSSHWEAIAGAREFAEYYFFSNEVQEGSIRPWMFLGYDFSSDSCRLGYFSIGGGTFTGASGGSILEGRYIPVYDLFKQYLNILKQKGYDTDLVTSGQSYDFPIPTSHMYDSEAAIMTGILAFTLRTTYSLRFNWGTPFSTFETVDPNNLKPQLTFAFYVSFFIANQDDFGTRWQRPLRGSGPQAGIADERAGSGVLVGDVVVYDRKSGFYDSTPLLQKEYTTLVVATHGYSRLDPFSQIIVMADERGRYKISGVMGWRCAGLSRIPEFGASSTIHVASDRANPIDVTAYVLDNRSGTIIYAKDLGDHGEKTYSSLGVYGREWTVSFPVFKRIVVFKCGTLALTDVLDPTNMKPPDFDINTRDTLEAFEMNIEVRNLASHTSLEAYGAVTPSYTYESLALVFIPTEWVIGPVEIVLRYGRQYALRGLLTNSTETYPDGAGYRIQSGEQKIVTFTSLHVARSLFYLNQKRESDLRKSNILIPTGEEQHELARQKLSEAEICLSRKDYEGVYLNSLLAWSYEVLPYSSIFDTLQQVLTTNVFFSLLLIPFSFMLEKIAFDKEGKLRFVLISLIFTVTYLIFSILNPSTLISANSFMVILGFVVMTLTLYTFYVLINSFVTVLRNIRAKILGPHFVTSKLTSVLMTSWSVGVGNMRKRKSRTFLFLITLILTFTCLVSLSSITVLSFTQISKKEEAAPYDGMLIQLWRGGYLSRIPKELLSIIEKELKNVTVCARSYFFFPLTPTIGFPHMWLVGKDGKFLIKAAEGLTPQETSLTNIDSLILPGGRWFHEYDTHVAIISEYASKITGIQVGDEIDLLGLKLRVVGILKDEADYLLKDMGNLALSPQAVPPPMGERAVASIQTIPFKETILIPYKLAEELGGKVYSIAVRSKNETQVLDLARNLNAISSQEFSIIAHFENNSYYFGYAKGLQIKGTSLFFVPTLLSILMVFNLMLGLVYERKREINILSLVGLAPSEISTMFVAESAEYALLSVVIGYLVGVAAAKVLLDFNIISLELFPQFTSVSMLMLMFSFIIVVMSGAIYPSLVAGKLGNPSQRRRWEISEPVGDIWEINMPFISDQSEMQGFLLYLAEYLKQTPNENFEIESLFYEKEVIAGREVTSLNLKMRLAPFAAQMIQAVKMKPVPEREDKLQLRVLANRISGERDVWMRGHRNFIDVLRKQMLIWRSLEVSERLKYIKIDGEVKP